MTVLRPNEYLAFLERTKIQVRQVLGPQVAKRLELFSNGGFYIRAGNWRRFLAWLVDVVVLALGLAVGVFVVASVDLAADLDNGVVVSAVLAVLFLVPLLYGGFCFRNGRALGGVLTGTQLVRITDGSRIGRKASWAMLLRGPMPLLYLGAIASVFTGGGIVPDVTARVCVDPRATQQLRTSGVI